MFRTHRIAKGATVTLLAAFGFLLIIWAQGRSAPPPARAATDTVKAVELRFNFGNGDWANVTEVEGGTIQIEKNGKKLQITPFVRDQGKVELRVSQAVQRDGKEVMQSVDTLLVDKSLTKLNHGNLPLSVQVLDLDKRLPADALSAPGGTCCVRTCSGTLVCGTCVCTDCGRCGPNWCDCALP
jgi:hypothetical protein